jgi:pimeloyl-ACP methyl ester carboxylesterase
MLARRLKLATVSLAIAYAGITGLVALFYRTILYPAPKSGLEPRLGGALFVRMGGDDGTSPPVLGLYAKAPPGAPTLVHFHGNGEELVDQVPLVRDWMDRGLGVLAVEYPGYGMAAAERPSEEALYAAADRALAWLEGQGVSRSSTVLVGFSLGSGVAAEMARRGRGDRLVLIAPYTSVVDMASRYLPIVPTSLLIGDRFDTIAKAPEIAQRTLVVHGDADPVIPIAMGRRVAAALPSAELVVVSGGHHNDLFARDRSLADRVADFARGAGPPRIGAR